MTMTGMFDDFHKLSKRSQLELLYSFFMSHIDDQKKPAYSAVKDKVQRLDNLGRRSYSGLLFQDTDYDTSFENLDTRDIVRHDFAHFDQVAEYIVECDLEMLSWGRYNHTLADHKRRMKKLLEKHLAECPDEQ
jgi:hypothetical protein